MTLNRVLAAMTAMLTGCASGPKPAEPVVIGTPAEKTGCTLMYNKQDLEFSCGDIKYDLFQNPVREERKYDLVDSQSFTRRHYVTTQNGHAYMFMTEQIDQERYPARILLQTPKGVTRIQLDKEGNIRQALSETGFNSE